MDTKNNDSHPCETCLRWDECNGVDWLACQEPEKPRPDAAFAELVQVTENAVRVIIRLVNTAGDIARWGLANRPRLMHLALHGKTARVRKKNMRRVTQEYIREVVRCAENG